MLYLTAQFVSLPGSIALSEFLREPVMRLPSVSIQTLTHSPNATQLALISLKPSPSMSFTSDLMSRVTTAKGVVAVEQNHI